MKKTKKILGIIAILVIIGFGFWSCEDPHTHTAGAAACLTEHIN